MYNPSFSISLHQSFQPNKHSMPGHAMAASQTRLHQAEAQAGTWPTAKNAGKAQLFL